MPKKLVTIFSCPKPFTGHDAVIQTNALRNWRALGVNIILLGDDPGVAEAAEAHECRHIPGLQKTKYGTPLLSNIFAKAQAACTTPLICYSNADILFPKSLLAAAQTAAERFPQFLITGQRWDVDVTELISDTDVYATVAKDSLSTGTLHGPGGMDYFIFPCGMIAMPPFAIGRPSWDNWMIWQTFSKKIPVVDGTAFIPIIHQNHDYSHVPGKVAQNWENSPESIKNRELFKSLCPDVGGLLLTAHAASWRIAENGFMGKNILPERDSALISQGNKEFFDKYPFALKFKRILKKFGGEKVYTIIRYVWHILLLRKYER